MYVLAYYLLYIQSCTAMYFSIAEDEIKHLVEVLLTTSCTCAVGNFGKPLCLLYNTIAAKLLQSVRKFFTSTQNFLQNHVLCNIHDCTCTLY